MKVQNQFKFSLNFCYYQKLLTLLLCVILMCPQCILNRTINREEDIIKETLHFPQTSKVCITKY
jgi:hypothetical protein